MCQYGFPSSSSSFCNFPRDLSQSVGASTPWRTQRVSWNLLSPSSEVACPSKLPISRSGAGCNPPLGVFLHPPCFAICFGLARGGSSLISMPAMFIAGLFLAALPYVIPPVCLSFPTFAQQRRCHHLEMLTS